MPSPSQGQQQHEAQSAPSTPVQQQQTQTQLTPVTVVFHGDCARHSYKRGPTDPTVERPDRLAYVREGVEFLLGSPVPSPVPWRAIESARSVPLYDPVVLAAHSREFIDDLHKWTQESGSKLARKEVELPANLDADDLYLCPESITAMSGALGAAFDAVDNVCHPKAAAAAAAAGHEQRSAFAAIRPPGHHATCKDPSGFCYINNAVCAALYAHSAYRIQRVAIIGAFFFPRYFYLFIFLCSLAWQTLTCTTETGRRRSCAGSRTSSPHWASRSFTARCTTSCRSPPRSTTNRR